MKNKEVTVEVPGLTYGYSLRDYKGNVSELSWSWAVEVSTSTDRLTDYNYAMTKFGATVAAWFSIFILKRKILKAQK